MDTPKEWFLANFGDFVAEHNAAVRAWQRAMAEIDRLAKINGAMCDTIHDMDVEIAEIKARLENAK